jgi:O-antigen/teichoic acid export membrane protein
MSDVVAEPSARGTSQRTVALAVRSAAASSAMAYLINLLVLPLVLHRVGVELYGAWAVVASILAVAGLADAGVRTELIRRVGEAQGRDDRQGMAEAVDQALTILTVSATLVVVVGWFGAPWLRDLAFPHGVEGLSPGTLDWFVRSVVALLAISLVGNGVFGVLRGVQRSDIESRAQMLAVPAGAVCTCIGVLVGWGLWSLVAGSAAQLATQLMWEERASKRLLPWVKPRLTRVSRVAVKAYLALSGLALLSQVSDVIDTQWDKIVLSRFVGTAAVTSFQVSTSLVLQAKLVALLPLTPVLAGVAELHRRDRREVQRLFRTLERSAAVAAAVMLSTVFVFGARMLQLWLRVPLTHSESAVRLFTVAVLLNLMCAPLAFRAIAEGLHRVAAIASLANMAVNGIVSFAATASLGFNGALYGSILGNLIGAVVFLCIMRRHMIGERVMPEIRPALVGAVGAVVGLALRLDQVEPWPLLIVVCALFAAGVATAATGSVKMRFRSVWEMSW